MTEIKRGVGRPRKKPPSPFQDGSCRKFRIKNPSVFSPGDSVAPPLYAFELEPKKFLVVSENDLIAMLSAIRIYEYDL